MSLKKSLIKCIQKMKIKKGLQMNHRNAVFKSVHKGKKRYQNTILRIISELEESGIAEAERIEAVNKAVRSELS